MTLPIPPVNDWQDVQYAFDAIATRFPLSAKDLANDSVTAAQIAAGGVGTSELATGAVDATKLATGIVLQLAVTGTTRKVAFGTSSLAFAASAVGGTVTVTPGFAPVRVVVSCSGNAPAAAVTVTALNYTATTFDVTGRASAAITFTQNFDWIAVG